MGWELLTSTGISHTPLSMLAIDNGSHEASEQSALWEKSSSRELSSIQCSTYQIKTGHNSAKNGQYLGERTAGCQTSEDSVMIPIASFSCKIDGQESYRNVICGV